MQPDLTANGDWEQAVICLPNYVADKNTTLSMVLNTSGSCQSNFNQDWYFDDFRLVPDANCGFTAILGDGDFSRSLERQIGWPFNNAASTSIINTNGNFNGATRVKPTMGNPQTLILLPAVAPHPPCVCSTTWGYVAAVLTCDPMIRFLTMMGRWKKRFSRDGGAPRQLKRMAERRVRRYK